MSFAKREPRENATANLAFPRPTRTPKVPKPLRPRHAAPGEPRKYSTLSRGKPMERGGRIKWKPARRIARETPEEKLHKNLIRQARVCAVAKYAFAGRCRGGFVVAHIGPSGGTSAKHGDWTMSTLMCHSHHMQHDGHQKPSVFDGMSNDELLAFREHEIHLAREFVAGRRMVSA